MKPIDPSLSRRDFLKQSALLASAVAGPASLAPALVAQSNSTPKRKYPIIGFTKPFQNLGIEETADTVAAIGWDGVECPVRPKGHIEPERAEQDLPKLVEALRKRGKEFTVLTTGITSVKEPGTEKLLRLAARLGIKKYRLGQWKYDLKRPVQEQIREIGAQLKDLAQLNKELGLQGGFQNHSGRDYVGAPIWDIWTMIRDLDPKHLGICFDIGHATIEGGTAWPIHAKLMEGHFTAVFIKDFLWTQGPKGWNSKWVMLGEGMVNRSFITWLKNSSYSGPICQHQEYDHGSGKPMIEKMQADLRVLREWLA